MHIINYLIFKIYDINMIENNLEHFLDSYINHTRVLNSKFIANNFMKNELNIQPKNLTRKHITPELKEQRKKIAQDFLKIIRERNYKKEANIYIAN